MQDDRPSATAYRVALRRAAHQILDDPKVFDDPLAMAIVGGEGETRRRGGEGKSRGRIARSMRAYMAMRSRYAEDRLAEAVERGARQYVELAAELSRLGFGQLEDSGMDEMNRRYFANRADGLRVAGGLAHVMAARV